MTLFLYDKTMTYEQLLKQISSEEHHIDFGVQGDVHQKVAFALPDNPFITIGLVTCYTLYLSQPLCRELPDGIHLLTGEVTLEKRNREKDSWAVCNGCACLNTDWQLEVESMPSNRTDEFLARTRFPQVEAWQRALHFLAMHRPYVPKQKEVK